MQKAVVWTLVVALSVMGCGDETSSKGESGVVVVEGEGGVEGTDDADEEPPNEGGDEGASDFSPGEGEIGAEAESEGEVEGEIGGEGGAEGEGEGEGEGPRCDPVPEECDGLDTDCDGVVDDGEICPGDLLCRDGDCGCWVVGRTECGQQCVDTEVDADHCGECDSPCEQGQVCAAGECLNGDCGEGLTSCARACVDLQTTVTDCGACVAGCVPLQAASAECVAGECVLGECVDGAYDSNGAAFDGCEYICGPIGDDDTCDRVDDDCDGVRDQGFDLRVDHENCGACGRACDEGSACVAALCVEMPPGGGRTLAVGDGEEFATLAEALAAAQDGDIVALGPGEHAPFDLAGAGVTVVGAAGLASVITGSAEDNEAPVRITGAGSRVRGVRIDAGGGALGVQIHCEGGCGLELSHILGVRGTDSEERLVTGGDGVGVTIVNSPGVVLIGNEIGPIRGGDGMHYPHIGGDCERGTLAGAAAGVTILDSPGALVHGNSITGIRSGDGGTGGGRAQWCGCECNAAGGSSSSAVGVEIVGSLGSTLSANRVVVAGGRGGDSAGQGLLSGRGGEARAIRIVSSDGVEMKDNVLTAIGGTAGVQRTRDDWQSADGDSFGVRIESSRGVRSTRDLVFGLRGATAIGLWLEQATATTTSHLVVHGLWPREESVAIRFGEGSAVTVDHAIFSSVGRVFGGDEAAVAAVQVTWSAVWDAGEIDFEAMQDNPRFWNPDAGDLRLRPDSPAIDAGDPEAECEAEPAARDGGCRIDLGHLGGTSWGRSR